MRASGVWGTACHRQSTSTHLRRACLPSHFSPPSYSPVSLSLLSSSSSTILLILFRHLSSSTSYLCIQLHPGKSSSVTMSDMRLRSIIRAPVRYGEAKPKEPAASASQRIYIIRDLSSSGGDEKLPASYRRQKSPVCPRTKPYDPNRPPVPWCTKPYPGQAEKEAWTEAYSVYRESLYPPVSSGVAKSSIECFVVSNVLTNNDEFEDERDGIGWARNPRMSSNRFVSSSPLLPWVIMHDQELLK